MRAGETVLFSRDVGDRATLMGFRNELLQLRLTWEAEILSLLQTTPDVVNAWRKNTKAWQLVEHVLPSVEKARCLQLALFADYCIAVATDSEDGLLHSIVPQEIHKVKQLTDAFERHKSLLKNLDAYAEIAQVADTLQAYYDFLQQLSPVTDRAVKKRSPKPQ